MTADEIHAAEIQYRLKSEVVQRMPLLTKVAGDALEELRRLPATSERSGLIKDLEYVTEDGALWCRLNQVVDLLAEERAALVKASRALRASAEGESY